MKFSHSKKILFLISFMVIGLLYSFEIQNATTSMISNYQPITLPTLSIETNPPPCITDPDIQFFMYHYIRAHDPRDNIFTTDLSVDPKDFRTHMQYIQELRKEGKIYTMNGSDFLNAIEKQCFPAKHIWIFTSDDGWSDTYSDLYPIANEYRVPFFLGIITNRLDTPGFVTTEQVQEISRNPLFSISSHSITHSEQNKMDSGTETQEMCESKIALEKLIGIPVLSYIYPEGRMSKDSGLIAQKCGYELAWSTGYGTNWNSSNQSKYDINRTRIHHTSTIDLFKNIVAKYK